jgi:DNA-binding GntR family transcriptional regulator
MQRAAAATCSPWRSGHRQRAHAGLARRNAHRSHADRVSAPVGARTKPRAILTRPQLLDAVRGGEVEAFDRAIDTHIKNIRRKVEPDSRRPRYILTVYGMGYKFAE